MVCTPEYRPHMAASCYALKITGPDPLRFFGGMLLINGLGRKQPAGLYFPPYLCIANREHHMTISFDEYQGAGNDFLLPDSRRGTYKDLSGDQIRFSRERRLAWGATV